MIIPAMLLPRAQPQLLSGPSSRGLGQCFTSFLCPIHRSSKARLPNLPAWSLPVWPLKEAPTSRSKASTHDDVSSWTIAFVS